MIKFIKKICSAVVTAVTDIADMDVVLDMVVWMWCWDYRLTTQPLRKSWSLRLEDLSKTQLRQGAWTANRKKLQKELTPKQHVL